MKPCWPEGDLRAYLDRELPLESQERIAGHLEVCGACSARCRELSDRAARVSSLMATLPEPAPAGAVRVLPPRTHHSRQWAVAALSLAAALAIGFVVLPKRGGQPASIVKAPVAVAAVPVEKPAALAQRPLPRPAIRRPAPRTSMLYADFLRLDDEPLETGTVVRVSAENGDVQADLIVGPDGRAHAIRVVSNQ
jgi:hypothetical protein